MDTSPVCTLCRPGTTLYTAGSTAKRAGTRRTTPLAAMATRKATRNQDKQENITERTGAGTPAACTARMWRLR